MCGLVKAIHFVHVRRTEKSAVQAILPAVIRTANRLAQLAGISLAKSRPAVAADVVISPDFAVLVAQEDQALTHHLLHEIITCPGDLALMPHAQPARVENALPFCRKNLR